MIDPEQQAAPERVAAVWKFLLAAPEVGELTEDSRDTLIRRIDAGEIDAIIVGAHRKIPLGAFDAYGRSLPQQWRWQRAPRP